MCSPDVARISYSDVIQFLDEENEKLVEHVSVLVHDRTFDDVKGGVGVEGEIGVGGGGAPQAQGNSYDHRDTDNDDDTIVKKSNHHNSHHLNNNNNNKASSLSSFKMAQIQAQIKQKLKDSTRCVSFPL